MFELRHACRGLIRRPAYTAGTIVTLALVIGANASLFAAINATLFRRIPLRTGERTVNLYLMPPGATDAAHRNPLHAIDLVRLRERSRTLTHLARIHDRRPCPRHRPRAGRRQYGAGQRRDAAALDRESGPRPDLHR